MAYAACKFLGGKLPEPHPPLPTCVADRLSQGFLILFGTAVCNVSLIPADSRSVGSKGSFQRGPNIDLE